jgi:hypothetical protein
MSRNMAELRYNFAILNLGNRWREVVSFTSPSLYPRKNGSQHQIDRTKSGLQGRSRHYREETISYRYRELNPSSLAIQPVACCYTD